MSKKMKLEIKNLKLKLAYYKVYDLLWVRLILEKGLSSVDTLEELQETLSMIKPELERLHKSYMEDEPDERSGFETYGYENLETVKENIIYISDRWQCRFRVRWLLDLIDLDSLDG